MRVIVNIFAGPAKGRYAIHQEGILTVGRLGAAFSVPEDRFLSRLHFEVELHDGRCLVRDLNSGNGTFLNDRRIVEEQAEDGDEVSAGHSAFQILLELADEVQSGPQPPSATNTELENLPDTQRGWWKVMHFLTPNLYTILDAAAGEPVRDFIALCGLPTKSLYEGAKGDQLERFAPYLLAIPPKSDALRKLLVQGWGKNWGIFLSSPLDFIETRRHLRRFLLVKLQTGRTNYFRYYDPRVVREFLPRFTPEETAEFFGPIKQFLMPHEDPEKLLRFTHAGGKLKKMEIELKSQA